MARVVVISRNPTLSWALAAHDRDLLELRPHQIDTWLDERITEATDLVVIDLDDPARGASIVVAMRASGQMAPALLVTADDDQWSRQAVGDLPGAEVLPLPITTDSLNAAVVRALDARATREPRPEQADESARAQRTTPETDDDESHPQRPAADAPSAAIQVTQGTEPINRLPGIRRSSRTAQTVREALAGTDLTAQIEQFARSGAPAPQHAADESTVPAAPALAVRPTRAMDSANALARSLMLRVDELYSVTETAEVIVADALGQVAADAAALMLPDQGRWRVAAGVGLGSIERRFELDEQSWVVSNVARGNKGVLIEDTDVARRPFQSAPLASRRHLLAAPIPLVEGILLIARDEDPPFDEAQLNSLASLAVEAGLLLAAALDVRELARKLQAFAELDD